jgi:isocitrate dehydrogenase (NAD+)
VKEYNVVELLGDGIGPELTTAVHKLIDAMPFKVNWETIDFSVEGRNDQSVYDRAVKVIENCGYAMKYPTATVKESPNQVMRKRLDLSVIHRPVATIPGVRTNFSKKIDLDIVRVATGGTYTDPGRQIGEHAAVALRIIESGPCRYAAHFAFNLATKLNKTVTSSSKYTIQRFTDGFFESICDEVDAAFPKVRLQRELFDALLAKLIMKPDNYQVVLVLNEYGDFLSDMACGLVGSLGLGASGNYSFNKDYTVRLGMFDAAHGTAPDIAGKGLANPTAIFLACELMMLRMGEDCAAKATRATIFDLLEKGTCTGDLGGKLNTTEFTEEVIRGVKGRLKES